MSKPELPADMIVFAPLKPAGARHHLYFYPQGVKDPVLVCIRFDDDTLFKGDARKTWRQEPEKLVEMQEFILEGLANEFERLKSQIVDTDFRYNPEFPKFIASVGFLLELTAARGGGNCRNNEGHHVLVSVEPSNQKHGQPGVSIKSAIVDAVEPLCLEELYLWVQSEFADGSQPKRLKVVDAHASLDNVAAQGVPENMLVLDTSMNKKQRHHLYIYPLDDEHPMPVCLRFGDEVLLGTTEMIADENLEAFMEMREAVIIRIADGYCNLKSRLIGSGLEDEDEDAYKKLVSSAAMLLDMAFVDMADAEAAHHILMGVGRTIIYKQAAIDCEETLSLDSLHEWLLEDEWLLEGEEDLEDEEDLEGEEDLEDEDYRFVSERSGIGGFTPLYAGLFVVDSSLNAPIFDMEPTNIIYAANCSAAAKRMALTNAITTMNTLAEMCIDRSIEMEEIEEDMHGAAITILRSLSMTKQLKKPPEYLPNHKMHMVIDLAKLKTEADFHGDDWFLVLYNEERMTLNDVMEQVREINT